MLKMVHKYLNWKFKCNGLIITVAVLITFSDAQCSQDTNSVYRYGTGCAFMCHCLTSEQCDVNTGECQSGCDFDWVGPGCQYKNIAVRQISRQIDNISPPQYSSRANDRSVSTCSYTGDENTHRSRNPWWKVWLPYNFTMRQMEILTLDSHRGFFDGFKVIVEYVPEKENININYYPDQSKICYTHNDTTLKNTSKTVTCDKYFTGNQVRIQLSAIKTQLVLCDVRIYGGRNFAFGRIAKQSSVNEDNISLTTAASRAVDGKLQSDRLGVCSVTNMEDEPWWTVDLDHLASIFQVSIFNYTNENGIGYKIFASNDTSAFNLVNSIDGNSKTTIDISATFISSNVKITPLQTQKRLAICEVQIFGDCLENVCGYNCTKVCHCKNITATDKLTGICSNGCTGRWSGDGGACNIQCKISQWGETCQNKCGQCRDNETCNVVTGNCPGGCEDGYKKTDLCDTECEDGMYGQNCTSNCSGNCKNNTPCKKRDGHCVDGCSTGYIEDKCDDHCPQGYYGTGCNGKCSSFCTDGLSSCSYVNGHCLRGCESGYQGQLCDEECDSGTFGTNCTGNCSKNCENVCDKVTGNCKSCKAGWKGSFCKEGCENGTFGVNCSSNCNATCNHVCDKATGTCTSCKAGWKGLFCERECDEEEWGMNCNQTCGKCRDGDRCNAEKGVCSGGCMPGYKPTQMCIDACDNGTFGINCTRKCSVNCLEQDNCNRIDGTCDGCKDGWQGTSCDTGCQNETFGMNCSFHCGSCRIGSVCNATTGVCQEGCLDGFTGEMCEEEIKERPEKPSPVVGIAAGISGAVVVSLIAVGVVIFIRRRKTQKKPAGNNEREISPDVINSKAALKLETTGDSNIYVNSVLPRMEETSTNAQDPTDNKPPEGGRETIYYNTQSEHEVLVSELEAYVKTGLGKKDYFIKQFQQIPYGMKYPSIVATKKSNLGKNRYKSMYAYDHSRVLLKTLLEQPDSDYINATYIKGHFSEKAYIAAQGPISKTLGDFWRMIWENNIKTVIMATNLSEEGKMKCYQYWAAAEESVQYGNIIVVTDTEDVFAEFTVRRLTVTQTNKPDKKKTVTQFHYTAWPDKDVPRSTSSLLHFWNQVRRQDGKKTQPWLVHCSAGVGRTGTFIALDILYDEGMDNGSIDVFKCVEDLREQRVNMVQNKDQYKYLHSIIVEALVLPSQPVKTEKFHSIYNDLKEIDPKTRKTKLLLQYETLMCTLGTFSGKETEDDTYTTARRTEKKNKNRHDNILAPNEFRPFLLTQVPGCTDYINGVFIPGYRDKFGYIIAQTPLKSTAVDCCRLVYEQDVKEIVTFLENDDVDVGNYLPERGSVKLGPFSVKFVAEENNMHYIKRDYQLTYKSEKRSVAQLIFKDWSPSGLTPSDSGKMLSFIEELENLQRHNDNKPVLAQCLNGAERSGLLVVLMNILERLRFDNEVSIPLLIRQLKIIRQQIIPNYEQFKFCHDVVLCHIEKSSTYANM